MRAHKIISVPLDAAATHALNYDEALPSQLVEERLTQDELDVLFLADYFELLNQTFGCNIDDFEDAQIIGRTNSSRAMKLLDAKYALSKDLLGTLHHRIRYLFKTATELDTGVYFFF